MIERLRELYEYRELLFNITKKELKLRYRSSFLGFLWSLLNPLLMMLIFSLVFSRVFKGGIADFPVFLLVGLLPWNFFNAAVAGSTGSILAYGGLVKKVYFPRAILPLAQVLSEMVNYLLAMLILFVFLIYYGYNFWIYLPFVLLIVIIQTILCFGLALILSALNVYFRDIQQVIGVLLMALFYGTPIIYTIQMIESTGLMKASPLLLTIYKMNPVTALITLYRNCFYDLKMPDWGVLAYAAGVALFFLFIGFIIFHKLEPAFAEEV